MKPGLYGKVSTDEQVEKYGLPSQLGALRKRCSEKGWPPVFDGDSDVFIDDGYSGSDLDRPALNRLRRAVSEGRIDVVLAYYPDRLSRKLCHQMILAKEFESHIMFSLNPGACQLRRPKRPRILCVLMMNG
jgi:site-specific DNA recombinase